MTQEERRALFHKRVEIGKRRNDACMKECKEIDEDLNMIDGMDIITGLQLAWAQGCRYGKEHAEELKIFDND